MALLVQGAISLVLVGFGAFTNDGFSAMVAFSAPAFWLFLLLTGIALFILRYRETGNTPSSSGRFRVPLYPLTPALFCLSCGYMLWSSFGYVRFVFNSGDTQRLSGLAGLGVLALGIPLLLWLKKRAQA
jgi:amino acid transporter